jgi:hypothetical protein
MSAQGDFTCASFGRRFRVAAGEFGRDTTVTPRDESGIPTEIGLFLGSLHRHVAGTSIAYLGATRASEVSE